MSAVRAVCHQIEKQHDEDQPRRRGELCTDTRRRQGYLPDFTEAVLAAGVHIVQLREQHLAAVDELELLAVFTEAVRRHGRLLAADDRANIARKPTEAADPGFAVAALLDRLPPPA